MAIYKEDIVDVELEGGSIQRSFLSHTIGEGDKKANRFGVRAFRNGVPEALNGSCTGYFIRADGGTVTISGTVSGNVAYVELPEACYAIEGPFALAIKVSGSGVTGTLRIVDGVVSNTTTGTIIDPGTIIPSIEDLMDEIEAAVASIPSDYSSLWTSLAATFDASRASGYEVGEMVTYDGKVYVCVSPHEGAWNAAHFQQVSVGSQIGNLLCLMGLESVNFKRVDGYGFSNDGSLVQNSNWAYAQYTLNGETEIYYSGYGINPNYVCNFLDSENNVISYTGLGVTAPTKIAVPTGAVKVIVNGRKTDLWFSGIYVKTPITVNEQIKNLKNSADFINHPNLATGQDLDDISEPGIYAKSPTAEVDNWPFESNHQGRLIVFSKKSEPALYTFVQLVFDTKDSVAAFRGADAYGWMSWVYLADSGRCFVKKANLSTGDDLNDLWEMGTYAKSPSAQVANWPFAANHGGRVNVYSHLTGTNKYTYVQTAFDVFDGKMAFRISGDSWLPWEYVGSNSILSPATKVGIIGDSISTYEGYSESHSDTVVINGVSYPYRGPYYPTGNVDTVGETWWKLVCSKANVTNITVSAVSRSNLRTNATVDNTDGVPAPWHPDRVSRIVNAAPDVVFINIGINDMFGWSDSRDGAIPDTTVVSEIEALPEGTARGLALLICKLRTAMPNVKIIGIIPKSIKTTSYFSSISKMCETLIETYRRFGADRIIDLRACGINPFNAASYAVDGDGIHPNASGMAKIADYIISQIK